MQDVPRPHLFEKEIINRVPTAQGKQGKWQKKIPVRDTQGIWKCFQNTGNLEIWPKHRENTENLVCSSSKFPDSKGKRYFEICQKRFDA